MWKISKEPYNKAKENVYGWDGGGVIERKEVKLRTRRGPLPGEGRIRVSSSSVLSVARAYVCGLMWGIGGRV